MWIFVRYKKHIFFLIMKIIKKEIISEKQKDKNRIHKKPNKNMFEEDKQKKKEYGKATVTQEKSY